MSLSNVFTTNLPKIDLHGMDRDTARVAINDFVNDIFGYDFDIKKEEYVYIQYKILGDNVILNIYDNKNNNRFKAYIFTMNDIDNDEDTKYINVKEEYDKYKNGNKEKITLMASLLLSKNNNEKKEIIESLFSGKIKDIFSHYFL